MQISFNKKNRTFRLDTENVSYAMMIGPSGELRHLYYGAALGKDDDVSGLAHRFDRAFSPNPEGLTPDTSLNIACLEYTAFGSGDFHNAALALRKENGTAVTSAVYKSHVITKGKAPLPGLPASFAPEKEVQTLEITLADSFSGAEIVLRYSVFADSDVIARSVKVVNPTKQTIRIEKLMSAELDFDSCSFDMLYLQGKWARERHAFRTPLQPGMQGFRSARGSTGHQYNPGVVFAEKSAAERHGDVYGMLLLYSGSYAVEVEVDEYESVRAMLGVNSENFTWNLKPGEEFNAPEALLLFSANGFDGLSEIGRAHV